MQNSNRFWKMLMNTWREKESERTGELCPECGSELVYRVGRYGKFISVQFPSCRYTKSEEEEDASDEVCPHCGSKMVMKKGRYGSFLACSNYPTCKYIKNNKPKEEPAPTGVKLSGMRTPAC